MQLERQFAGPLQDTIIQRWRDPADGTICYIYLPITAPHSPPTGSGYVQYGSNTIGSISCVTPVRPPPPAPPPTRRKRSSAQEERSQVDHELNNSCFAWIAASTVTSRARRTPSGSAARPAGSAA